MNRKQRRAEEKIRAKDHVVRERRFKDEVGNYRVVVELTFSGEMGISLYKNGLLVAGDDEDNG